MMYQIGDTVVHQTCGPGQIIGIDEKNLGNKINRYYVIKINNLMLWVAVDDKGEGSLRQACTRQEFNELLGILAGPGDLLPDNQYQRHTELAERMQRRELGNVFHIVRDLTTFKNRKRLNQNDTIMLKRAEELLLNEWQIALGTPRSRALLEMRDMLKNTEI